MTRYLGEAVAASTRTSSAMDQAGGKPGITVDEPVRPRIDWDETTDMLRIKTANDIANSLGERSALLAVDTGSSGALPMHQLDVATISFLAAQPEPGDQAWEKETTPPRRGRPRGGHSHRWPRLVLATALLAVAGAAWYTGVAPLSEWQPSSLWQTVLLVVAR
jgi:hypothetical protein